MGNVTSGNKRRGSMDDDYIHTTGSAYGYPSKRKLIVQPSQADDSIVSILTDAKAMDDIASQLRDSRLHDASGKTLMYVGGLGVSEADVPEDTHLTSTLPTVFTWEGGGKEVYISGTFNGWKAKIPMVKSKHNFYTILDLPEGEHQYKFIVDGQWKLDQNQLITSGASGVQNNAIEVKASDFDVLAALSHDMAHSKGSTGAPTATGHISPSLGGKGEGWQQPVPGVANGSPDAAALAAAMAGGGGSPPGEYGRVIPPNPNIVSSTGAAATNAPTAGTNAATSGGQDATSAQPINKKTPMPPLLPPQLLQVILNKDTSLHCDPNLLPQPNHVMVNHMYALSIKDGVIVLSAITRYRQKYVSTVLYKPI